MSRWTYLGDSPATLVDGDFAADVAPGEEFDAPDDWKPTPYPHPLYREAKPKNTKAPEE